MKVWMSILIFAAVIGALGWIIYSTHMAEERKIKREREAVELREREILERGYFMGQKDYRQGEVHVRMDSIGNWYWIESPFDDNTLHYKPEN